MIFDTLANAKQYRGLNPLIDLVLEEAGKYTKETFPSEAIILNDSAKINVGSYETHPAETAKFEAHRNYIDVMVMVEGDEIIYVKDTDRLLEITEPYDESRDALFAKAEADVTAVRMTPGCFCILFPQDAHMPGCDAGKKSDVKKFIGKVRV